MSGVIIINKQGIVHAHQPTVQLNLQLIIVDVELIHRIADWLPNLNLEASISRTNNT
jgi:hypothetical protein